MTPAQWQRTRELFEQAVDLPAAEVQHWLTQQESDPAIVAEVGSLLEHHTAAGVFLDEAVAGRVSDLLAEDTVFEPGARSAATSSRRKSAAAGWAACIWPRTSASAGAWRSRCWRRVSFVTKRSAPGFARKRARQRR